MPFSIFGFRRRDDATALSQPVSTDSFGRLTRLDLHAGFSVQKLRTFFGHSDSDILVGRWPEGMEEKFRMAERHEALRKSTVGLYDLIGLDASRLSANNISPNAPTTNHRRTNSCPTADLSELIVDLIATPPTANESAGLQKGVVVSEMKKSAKDQALAA